MPSRLDPRIRRVERIRHCQCILNKHLGRLRCDHNDVTIVTWHVGSQVFDTRREALAFLSDHPEVLSVTRLP